MKSPTVVDVEEHPIEESEFYVCNDWIHDFYEILLYSGTLL